MAKKSNKEALQDMTVEQLTDQIADTKLRLKKLKFSHAIQPIDNPMEIRATKKEVARLMTELSKKNNESIS